MQIWCTVVGSPWREQLCGRWIPVCPVLSSVSSKHVCFTVLSFIRDSLFCYVFCFLVSVGSLFSCQYLPSDWLHSFLRWRLFVWRLTSQRPRWSLCIWSAPWKNRICSTTMKLRKSLVKPVTWQKTCNYIQLFGSSARDRIMHNDAFNVILWTSPDIMRRAWWSRVEEPNNTL